MAEHAAVLAALDDLADHLQVPEAPDLADRVLAALTETSAPTELTELPAPDHTARETSWRWLAAAAAVAVVAGGVVAVPASRHAVADWLGIGTVRVTQQRESPTPGVGADLFLGDPVPLDQATDDAGFTVLLPDVLGEPVAYLDPPGGVSFLWPPDPEGGAVALPETAHDGVGLLLAQLPGRLEEPLVEKRIGPGTTIEPVQVRGRPAYWITGRPHTYFFLDELGNPRSETTRLAGNTLLWEEGGVTYRLESALPLETALVVAESMR